ncbi:MAG: thioredoxin family protein [Chlamydiia bacterium]|nr:thioredoxin family protein [Chlamydiia bacterium]
MAFGVFTSPLYGEREKDNEDPGHMRESFETSPILSEEEPIAVTLHSEMAQISPGSRFWLAVEMEIAKGWHTYWLNPGDIGMPTQIDWQLPEGIEVHRLVWPTPEHHVQDGVHTYNYADRTVVLAECELLPGASPRDLTSIGVTARWLACNEEQCVPGDTDATIELPISPSSASADPKTASIFLEARKRLVQSIPSLEAKKEASKLVLSLNENEVSEGVKEGVFIAENPDVSPPEIRFTRVKRENGQLHLLSDHQIHLINLRGLLLLRDAKGKEVTLSIDAPLSSNGAVAQADFIDHSDGQYSLATLLIFALMGGLILNLMPCVLPVISIKALSLIKLSDSSRGKIFAHGLVYTVGILIAFWILAGLMIALKAYGNAVGWGFQLQNPLFVAALAILMLVMSLSLFGLFDFGSGVASWAGQKEHSANLKGGMWGSFINGLLATVVATPCSGPFLGTALGATLTLSAFSSLLVFTCVGLGMAAPFLLIGLSPSVVHWLPKPGAWMVPFKQLMGFFLLATALWLYWVFSAQTSPNASILLLGALFIIGFSCWLYGTFGRPTAGAVSRRVALVVVCMCVMSSFWVIWTATNLPESTESSHGSHSRWQPYSEVVFSEARAAGRPVFVDYTAKWCLICQANHLVLCSENVDEVLKERDVLLLKADLTRPSELFLAHLAEFGRSGVPLYLLYMPELDQPIVLPQVLTPQNVIGALTGELNNG